MSRPPSRLSPTVKEDDLEQIVDDYRVSGRTPRYDASMQSYLDRIPELARAVPGRSSRDRATLATVNLVINTESALNFAGTKAALEAAVGRLL